jgi:hypothetical protein
MDDSSTRYAALMSILTVTFAATNPPGDGDILGPPAPALLGFIETTSKVSASVPAWASAPDGSNNRLPDKTGRRPVATVRSAPAKTLRILDCMIIRT